MQFPGLGSVYGPTRQRVFMSPSVRAHTPSRFSLAVSATPGAQAAEGEKKPLSEVLKNAASKAAGGGIAGAVAMFVNVGTLMCAALSLPPTSSHSRRSRNAYSCRLLTGGCAPRSTSSIGTA